ncbi:MAG: polyprenyl diphosphate synthase [Bdellovibrionales bacterium]
MLNLNSFKHLAIIMDGNGRWAHQRKHKRFFGHTQGAKTAQAIVSKCVDLNIPYLSLFTLSTENTLRPESELVALVKIFEKILAKEVAFLMEKKIRLCVLGDVSFFSDQLQDQITHLQEKTKNHQGLTLIIALNYGGRQEIVNGARSVFQKIQSGELKEEDLGEEQFASFLPSSQFPEPDLIIRTGGNLRLSNFYLWSAAYSELYFTETLWPDFDEKCLNLALKKYSVTERKFGVL